MTESITLDELAETKVGQEIIRQRNEAAQAKVDAEELTRKTRANALQAQAKELATTVVVKRQEMLAAAESCLNAFAELDDAFSALIDVRRHLRPLDGKVEMPESRVTEHDVRQLVERVQAMARRFGRPL